MAPRHRPPKHLKRLMKGNILAKGPLRRKQVLLCIVGWKTSNSPKRLHDYQLLADEEVDVAVVRVVDQLKARSDDVYQAIKRLATLARTVPSISIGSTILRFLDSLGHRHRVIDRYLARFTNGRGIVFRKAERLVA